MILDLGQVFVSVLNSMNSKSNALRNYRRLLLFSCDLFQFLRYCKWLLPMQRFIIVLDNRRGR